MYHNKRYFNDSAFTRPHFNDLLCRRCSATLLTSCYARLRWPLWFSCSAQSMEPFQTEESQSQPKLSPIENEPRPPLPKMSQRGVPDFRPGSLGCIYTEFFSLDFGGNVLWFPLSEPNESSLYTPYEIPRVFSIVSLL